MQDNPVLFLFLVVIFLNIAILICMSNVNRKLTEMIRLFDKALQTIKDNEDEDYDSADWWK